MSRLHHADPDEYLGQVLADRYFIARRIGRGSFASVYVAQQPDGPPAAIKILHTQEPLAHLRFIREIKVMQALPPSDHLVGYMGHGTLPAGGAFLAMEYVTGKTLRAKMGGGLLEPEAACVVVYQVALALQPLHRYGIVHRDLKPSNVLMTPDGTVKLFDFGLVMDSQGFLRLFEEEDILKGKAFSEDVEEGVIVGTPEYMAVEQFQDAALDDPSARKTTAASDVFSLGVMLYRLVTGEFPYPMHFEGPKPIRDDYLRYFRWRAKVGIESVERPREFDDALWSIISRAIGAPVELRQPDGRAFADEILSYVTTGAGTQFLPGPRTDSLPALPIQRLVAEVDGHENGELLSEELSIQSVWSDLGDNDWLEGVPEAPFVDESCEDLTTKEEFLDEIDPEYDTEEISPNLGFLSSNSEENTKVCASHAEPIIKEYSEPVEIEVDLTGVESAELPFDEQNDDTELNEKSMLEESNYDDLRTYEIALDDSLIFEEERIDPSGKPPDKDK